MITLPSNDRIGPIDLVTIVVSSLDDATRTYSEGLGLQPVARGHCQDALALALGRADLVGARLAGLGGPGRILLRLIEAAATDPSQRPIRPGWRAVALQVADIDSVHERAIEAGFLARLAPAQCAVEPDSRSAEVVGPAGETIRLYQAARPAAETRLETPILPDWLMAVTSSRHIEQARGFHEGLLGGASWLIDQPAARDDQRVTGPIAVVEMAGGHLIRIEAGPIDDPGRSGHGPVACGLLSVRLGRGVRSAADESQLIRSCRVLAGPEGELIELL